VYVAGYTSSANFPNTAGGAQANHGGGFYDAFVARLNSSLTSILQSTYLGGSADDYAYALAIAGSGDVVVAGITASTNFPNTAGGAQAGYGGGSYDAFVARLNAALTQNPQSTYLGGSGRDDAYELAIASSGDVYVAGVTGSSNFPNTAGGAQASCSSCSSGSPDAFVARLNATLTSNPQSTYLGGGGDDGATALAIAGSGEVCVAGYTSSTNFPNTAGGAQPSHGGGFYDAFVARLDASLTSNPQSTYLGGGGDDGATALAIAGSGEVCVAGYTSSTNFPNTTGGAQASNGGGTFDAFVARLAATLTSNPQSTYLGGSGNDYASALTIAGSGAVYVAGYTGSSNFPNTAGGAQASYGGGIRDAFVARLNATLTANPQSTYLGGSGYEEAYALAIAGSGEVVVAGGTDSTNFPNTAGGAQASYGGGTYDAFVARLTADLAASTDMVANAPTVPPSLAPGGSYNLSFSCTNAGMSSATNATCSIAASSGSVSGVNCTPPVPVASLAAGASITCTYTFTAPGSPGGGDTPQTGVTFTVTAGAANDSNAANNTASNAGGPVPLVDALDDAVTLPANTTGATFNLGSNDQVGAGSPPVGSTFTYQGGSCAGASVNSSTGVATFNVPASGTCTVQYQLCYNQACDTATLTVTAQQVQPIPTLDRWGLLALLACLATAGMLLLRRVVA
jgi:hypothetical protein